MKYTTKYLENITLLFIYSVTETGKQREILQRVLRKLSHHVILFFTNKTVDCKRDARRFLPLGKSHYKSEAKTSDI